VDFRRRPFVLEILPVKENEMLSYDGKRYKLPHELLKLRIKDVNFKITPDKYQYAELMVNGKTGSRPLVLIDSIPYLKDYLDHEHPQPGNLNAILLSGYKKSFGNAIGTQALESFRDSFVYITFNDKEVAKHVLQYHFMRIENLNDLYECWVFCKILYSITQRYGLKFKESRSHRGLATYKSHGDEFKIIYQARYATSLTDIDDESQSVVDVPDIVIEFRNGTTVIIDAKNSSYNSHSDSRPNIDQMRSYMTTVKPKYGIFVHSKSEIPNLWKGVKDKLTKQEIY
jgi:hypothetical protein